MAFDELRTSVTSHMELPGKPAIEAVCHAVTHARASLPKGNKTFRSGVISAVDGLIRTYCDPHVLPRDLDPHNDGSCPDASRFAQYALYLRGFKNAPITGVRLVDCDLRGIEKPSVIENVQNLDLRNVRINGKLSAGNDLGAMLQVVPEMEFA